jgi:hypothetical protein
MYDGAVRDQRRNTARSGRQLDSLTPDQWYELTVAVIERIERVSALPAAADRTAVLQSLRPLLERLARG